MSISWQYVAGFVTPFLIVAVAFAIAVAAERGLEIECAACGYSTGPMNDTRRITARLRFTLHKAATGHHTRRWQRQHRKAES